MEWVDLLRALGLAAAIEGALYALFPNASREAMLSFMQLPVSTRQAAGLGLCIFGVVLVMISAPGSA